MSDWSPQQEAALKSVSSWLKRAKGKGGNKVFRLFGYAGTGKTTLAKQIAADAGGHVMFGAFTGKAAHVLHRKGCVGASTIHSMIYMLHDDGISVEPKFILKPDADVRGAKLVIIDECSMVDEALGSDLLSFNTPVLVLGDPAQLPPVRGMGFFTNQDPDVMLTEVHRQAKESAIVRLATAIRSGEAYERGDLGDARVIGRADITSEDVLGADQVLVGINRTRCGYNRRIRSLKGIEGESPIVGDKLVCLRNNREKKFLNGSLWSAVQVESQTGKDRRDGVTRILVKPEDFETKGRGVEAKVKNEFWQGQEANLSWEDKKGTDEFTFGYALTVHKSQGSQWDSVVCFDESGAFRDEARRWLYTAVTRAAKKLTLVAA